MAPPASAFRLLRLVPVLVVLPSCAGAPISVRTPHDPHSLGCDFNVTSNKQPRCMAQCLMGRMDLLLYDCHNQEIKYVNNMLKGTQTLEDMTERLRETGESMRKKLPDLTPEKYTQKVSPTLQVGLKCLRDSSGSWEFHLPGQWHLFFDSKSGKYKADNSRGEEMKKKWEKQEGMNEFLRKTSGGDCKGWLKALVDRKTERETTAAPTTASASASPPTVSATPTMANASASPPTISPTPTMATAAASLCKTLIIIAPITLIVIFVIGLCTRVWKICIKRRCCSGAPESGSSSTHVPSGRPPFHPPPLLTSDLQELQPLQPPKDRDATADATFVSSTAWK